MAAIAVSLPLPGLVSSHRTPFLYSNNTVVQMRCCRSISPLFRLERGRNSIQGARAWAANPRSGMMMGGFGDDDIDEDDEDDDDDEEEEDRSLDLLVRFVKNIFRKVSREARRAVKSVLPVPISKKLVGFAVDGTIILTFLWVLKAFLQVICTLGNVVFASILLTRGIWTGISYFQESHSNRAGEDAWSRSRPAM